MAIENLIENVDSQIIRIRTKSLDVSFNELYDMYKNEELTISPDYQRLFRWEEEKQSRFIESLILEMPVPPIFVIETGDGIYELIDGLQRISSYLHKLSIDDQIIDTESNLRYLVLKKNLYKIGLPIDLFSDSQGDIDSLVNRRNSIAHGNFRSGISETEYSSWESKALSVMSNVMRLIYDYANNKMYLVS